MKRIAALLLVTTSITGLPANADAAAGRCRAYEPLLQQLAPKGGWDVNRMSRYMWRESRCTPHVRSRSQDTGLLQINDVNLSYLSRKMGFPVTIAALRNPATNIQAAALLCSYARKAWGNCYQPWAL